MRTAGTRGREVHRSPEGSPKRRHVVRRNRQEASLQTDGGGGFQEDDILLEGHRLHGNKWTEIAKMVQGRYEIYSRTVRILSFGRWV